MRIHPRRLPSTRWRGIAVAALLGLVVGCGDDSTGPESMATIRLNVVASGTTLPRAAGDLQIDRARLLVRRIVFKNAQEEEVDFSTPPRIVDLTLDGTVQELTVEAVPVGVYDEVRFDVHKLDDDDPVHVQLAQLPEFADFVSGDRASVVVDGTYDDGTGSSAFVWRSPTNDRQEVVLDPRITIDAQAGVVDVTLRIDASTWFVDASGSALDPRDTANDDVIETNIRESIEAFADDDRDGRRD